MYPFSCVLWAIFRQIARYLPHHRSENASKTHPKSSHDKFKTASNASIEGLVYRDHRSSEAIFTERSVLAGIGFIFAFQFIQYGTT